MPAVTDACGVDTRANALYDELIAGITIDIPDIDLSAFELPDLTDVAVTPLTNAQLTTGVVGGVGIFDVLMSSVKAHLLEQFDKGRITGAEYVKAYIELTQAAMANGTQFLLQKDISFWQAQGAKLAAFTAKITAAVAAAQYELTQANAVTAKAEIALTKMKLSTESMNFCTTKYNLETIMPLQSAQLTAQNLKIGADKDNVVSDTAIKAYNLTAMLPSQKAQVEAETLKITADKDISAFNLSDILPSQKAQIDAETTKIGADKLLVDGKAAIDTYNLTNILPKELAKITQEVVNLTTEGLIQTFNLSSMLPMQLLLLTEQKEKAAVETDISTYNLASMLPAQMAQIEAQTSNLTKEGLISTYNLTYMLPAQKSLLEAQTANQTSQTTAQAYQTTNILPEQVKLIKEQMEVQRAQTMNTRSDGATTIVGSVGKQKDLYTQQITSYQRDSEVKAAKLFTDAWITQKTIDEGLLAPTGFQNTSVDAVLTKIKTNNSLT